MQDSTTHTIDTAELTAFADAVMAKALDFIRQDDADAAGGVLLEGREQLAALAAGRGELTAAVEVG